MTPSLNLADISAALTVAREAAECPEGDHAFNPGVAQGVRLAGVFLAAELKRRNPAIDLNATFRALGVDIGNAA